MQNPLKTKIVARIALGVVILCCGFRVQACLNGFGASFEQLEQRGLGEYPHPIGHRADTLDVKIWGDVAQWKAGLEEGNLRNASNYGLYLIYAHRFAEAETQLRAVATRWPDAYASATNLGTVLEINGKNEEALQWIRKAVAIDSTADHGSEWIHVKILEAKVQGHSQLELRSTFGIDFGSELLPRANAVRRDVKLLQKQLFYQLNERITFIPPSDVVIAGLLYELGNTSLACNQMVPALKTYKLAKRYGCRVPLLKDRMIYARKHIREN